MLNISCLQTCSKSNQTTTIWYRFNVLFVLTFIPISIAMASKPPRAATDVITFDQNQDITKTYKNATEEKRNASRDQQKIEQALELLTKQLESLNREELMMLKDINQKTKNLADATSKANRKRSKKALLNAEKDLLNLIDSIRTNRQKMMQTEQDLHMAKNRLKSALKKIEAIETYIQSF